MFDISYFFIVAVLLVLYFISMLFSVYQKGTSGRGKFVFSVVDLILGTLNTILILYILLDISSLGQAFVPAATAVVCGSIIAASRLILRYILGRKRTLTDQQKAELMDL